MNTAKAVVEIPDFQPLLRHICKVGFEHHCAMSPSHTADAVAEAVQRGTLDRELEFLPDDAELATEFGDMTQKSSMGRRDILRELARRHGISIKDAYDAVERGKNLSTDQQG